MILLTPQPRDREREQVGAEGNSLSQEQGALETALWVSARPPGNEAEEACHTIAHG